MMRFSEGGCGDSLDKENIYRMMEDKENDKSNASARSRYISQFAKKVRDDANQKKTACWSSMGVPSTEMDPPTNFLKKFSRQLPSHISIADFIQSRRAEREQNNDGRSVKSNGNGNVNNSDVNSSRGNRGKLLHSFMSKGKSSSNSSIHQTYPSTSAVTLRNRNRPRPPWNSYYNSKHRQDAMNSRSMNGRRVPLLVRNRMNSRRANFRDADFSLPSIRNNNNHNNKNTTNNNSCEDRRVPEFYSLDDEELDQEDYDDEHVKLPPVTESTPNLKLKRSSSPSDTGYHNLNLSALNLPRLIRKENIGDGPNNNNNNENNNFNGLFQSSSLERIPPVHNNRRKAPQEPNVSIKDLLAQTDMQQHLAQKQKQKEEEEAMEKKLQQSKSPVDRRNIRESVPHLLSPSSIESQHKNKNINDSNDKERSKLELPRLCLPNSNLNSNSKERWREEEEEVIARLLARHVNSLNKSKATTKFPPINQPAPSSNGDQTPTRSWNPATGDSPRNLDSDRTRRDPHPNLLPADPKLAQSTCDAFILRKLLELQNRGENIDVDIGRILNSFRGRNGEGDENDERMMRTITNNRNNDNNNEEMEEMYNKENGRISDCYNGEVGYIERGQKDFILENAIKCARMPAKIPQKKIVDDFHGNGKPLDLCRMVYKQDYGQVPEYIKRRKEEIREEKEEMETAVEKEAQKKCRILTDAERKQIIQGLMQNWEELHLEFQQLPLFSSSHRVVKRKGEIEVKLRDLESDLRLVQRHGKLFVSNVGNAQFLWQ